jgi:hypothetical protein
MNLEELAKSNYVIYNDKIYRVCYVDCGRLNLEDENRKSIDVYAVNVTPLPITEELLVKNGFFHDFDTEVAYPDDSMFLVSPNKQITLHNAKDYINSDNIWSVHIDNSDFNSIANCELSYVHQLQNLCTLVNYNLKLDAFL